MCSTSASVFNFIYLFSLVSLFAFFSTHAYSLLPLFFFSFKYQPYKTTTATDKVRANPCAVIQRDAADQPHTFFFFFFFFSKKTIERELAQRKQTVIIIIKLKWAGQRNSNSKRAECPDESVFK